MGSVEDQEEIVDEVESRRSQADEREGGIERERSLDGGKAGADESEPFLLKEAIPESLAFDQSC